MPVCKTSSCRKRKDLNAEGICPACVLQSQDSTCKQCESTINIHSKALECDKCSSWCCIACTNVPEPLYDLIVSNNSEDGIKWFCHDCRISTSEPVTPPVTTNADTGNVAPPVTTNADTVCNKLKYGTCPHGVTGKTLVGGKKCEFAHPKLCKKYTRNGPHGRFGCNGSGCDLYHPMLCNDSVRNKKCHKPNCKLYHLRWTERSSKNPQRQQNFRGNSNNSARGQDTNQFSDRPNNYAKNYKNQDRVQSRNSNWGSQKKPSTPDSDAFLESMLSRVHVEMDSRLNQFENMLLRMLHHQPLFTEKDFPRLTQEGPLRSSQLRY